MKEAFMKLASALWQFGNSGQIACSVILFAREEKPLASTVGVLSRTTDDVMGFLDSAKDRCEQLAPAIQFSDKVWLAVGYLMGAMEGKGCYSLCILHPSAQVEDIVVIDGEISPPEVHAYDAALATVATSSRRTIEYVAPKFPPIEEVA